MRHVEQSTSLTQSHYFLQKAFRLTRFLEHVQVAVTELMQNLGYLCVYFRAKNSADNTARGCTRYNAWQETVILQALDNANVVHSKSTTS